MEPSRPCVLIEVVSYNLLWQARTMQLPVLRRQWTWWRILIVGVAARVQEVQGTWTDELPAVWICKLLKRPVVAKSEGTLDFSTRAAQQPTPQILTPSCCPIDRQDMCLLFYSRMTISTSIDPSLRHPSCSSRTAQQHLWNHWAACITRSDSQTYRTYHHSSHTGHGALEF